MTSTTEMTAASRTAGPNCGLLPGFAVLSSEQPTGHRTKSLAAMLQVEPRRRYFRRTARSFELLEMAHGAQAEQRATVYLRKREDIAGRADW